jgi:hypothetical protein
MEFFFFEVNPGRIRKGIVRANLIDEATAARRTLVRNDDAIERVLLCAMPGEPDRDAHDAPFRPGLAGHQL